MSEPMSDERAAYIRKWIDEGRSLHDHHGRELLAEREWLREKLDEANRKANAAQVLNSNQRQMVDQAEIEKGALECRIDNAVAELDQIADLLADSVELPVGQTAAIRLLNETIEALSGLARQKKERSPPRLLRRASGR